MKTSSREKLALVLFTFIILLGLSCFGAYLYVGHKWNHAATSIDDATGNLDGYTTLLFEGTGVPDYFNVDSPQAAQRSSVPLALVAQDYREKSSQVISINVVDPDYYRQPRVIERGELRFGIVSFQAGQSTASMQAKVKALRKQNVTCIVAIVPYSKLTSEVSGVDIVINQRTMSAPTLTKKEKKEKEAAKTKAASKASKSSSSKSHSSSTRDEYDQKVGDSVFFEGQKTRVVANAPTGTVKAIIISPSRMLSTKIISSV